MEEMQHSDQNCAWVRRTGSYHIEQQKASEDVLYRHETEKLRFYGLADGQSGKQFCTCGGRQVLKKLAEYMEKQGLEKLCERAYPDELQYEMIRVIRKAIDKLAAQYGTEREKFSSTVVAFAYDPGTYRFMTLHLGDGMILHGDGRRAEIISLPENGITRQYTWLTTSASAMEHLRIQTGYVQPGDWAALLSDGAEAVARGGNLTSRARRLLERPDGWEQLLQLMQEGNPEDDASLLLTKVG